MAVGVRLRGGNKARDTHPSCVASVATASLSPAPSGSSLPFLFMLFPIGNSDCSDLRCQQISLCSGFRMKKSGRDNLLDVFWEYGTGHIKIGKQE